MLNMRFRNINVSYFMAICNMQYCLHSKKFILIDGRPASKIQVKKLIDVILACRKKMTYKEYDKCINLITRG